MFFLFVFFFFFFLLLFFIITKSGPLAKIRWSVSISKFQKILYVSFSRADSELCIYNLFVWSNLNFLHKNHLGSPWILHKNHLESPWITLPTQLCLVLYSPCAHLMHSLIMWLIVSFLSQHNLDLLWCCVSFILALTSLILMALFYASIRKYTVSHLRFSFLSHVQVFSWETLLFCRLKCPYSCFSSHFCFLVIFISSMLVFSVLFLVAVINLPLPFLCVIQSFYRLIDAILNTGKYSSSFFSWHL